MAINLGTTATNSARYPAQRKIVKTTGGTLVVFSYFGNGTGGIKYSTSTDNGVNWSSWNATTDTESISNFDIYIESSNDILIVYQRGFDNAPRFIRLTYSSGTWSVGSIISVSTNSASIPKITKRSNGDLYILGNGGSQLELFKSTDSGASWSSAASINPGATPDSWDILPYSTKLWVFVVRASSNDVKIYEYDSSATLIATPATSITTDTNEGLSANKIDDSNIYFAVPTSSGIKAYYYNGSSWDSGTLLSDNSADEQPTIGIISTNIIVAWRDYDGSNYNIASKSYNGSWSAQNNWTADANADIYPTLIFNDSAYLYLLWNVGSTLYFDKQSFVNVRKTILSDLHIVTENNQKTILSDLKIINRYTASILSDSHIRKLGETKLLTSINNIIIQVLQNIDNKIAYVKSTLYNIENKFTIVKQITQDVINIISYVKAGIYTVENKFSSQKRSLYNIENKFSYLQAWQVASTSGFQSLGKTNIRVYINSIEQVDVDIDSITIDKSKDTEWTASFNLGRAYDSTKPADEAIVEIKYFNWRLYYGYISLISPTDSTEKIQINCSNKYWLTNRNDTVFFNIGHTPTDASEKYYDTPHNALIDKFSFNIPIGNFIPETINLMGVDYSTAISNIIQTCGNYGFYYDDYENKQLWSAEEGTIHNLNRQVIGENIKLYDVISHSFREDISKIVNKYKVQMGNKVVKGTEYAGYRYLFTTAALIPAWSADATKLAKPNTSNDYGYNYYPADEFEKYTNAYQKYSFNSAINDLEEWSDVFPPYLTITRPAITGIFFSTVSTPTVLRDGFSIDYTNGLVTLNQPIYYPITDSNGNIISYVAPTIRLHITKKQYYRITQNPDDDPETTNGNPLSFFTDKIGNYPTTILKTLNLSQFTIQEGATSIVDGVTTIIPSYDDTAFAKEFAEWQLSKIANKNLNGDIVITLDTVVFYNIQLKDRIYIAGITETPMNISSMAYNINDFTVILSLENPMHYKRLVSLQNHGE
jgi:hypothetical protein